MPSFATCLLAGAALVLAMDAAAPPVGIGLPLSSWPAVQSDRTTQIVNGGDKGDRLPLSVAQPSPRILVGCEPIFSQLSVAAQLNHSGRCMAAIAAARSAA